jgi:hypothetical protein
MNAKPIAFLFLGLMFLSSCITTKYQIDQGIVKDNFDIKIVEKNIVLQKDKFFNPEQLGLVTNKYSQPSFALYLPPWTFAVGLPAAIVIKKLSPIKKNTDFLALYKNDKVKSYNIEFTANNKKYYGKIAFFNAFNFAKSEGVCSYYQISIPSTKLAEVDAGRTSCIYEYYTRKSGTKHFPTWIIWMSEADIFH